MKRLWIPMISLVLAGLACNFTTNSEEDTGILETITTAPSDAAAPTEMNEDVEVPSTISEPTATVTHPPVKEDGPLKINLGDPSVYMPPEVFNSFRMTISTSFSGTDADGNPIEGLIQIEFAQVLDPLATMFELRGSGNADLGATGPLKSVEMDGLTYTDVEAFGCMQETSSTDLSERFDELFFLEDALMGEGERVLPDEVFNGMEVYVYELSLDNFRNDPKTDFEIEDLESGRIYIAKDDMVIVRFILKGHGPGDEVTMSIGSTGDLTFEIIYDFDADVQIEVPERCVLGETPYPVPEDARLITQETGSLSYLTDETPEALGEFYKKEMSVLGYELIDEFNTTGSVIMGFSGDGVEIFMTFNADPFLNVTSVEILYE